MNKRTSLDHETFRRLRAIYIIALGAIGLFTIAGQFFIQRFLNTQIDDSKIINISGRQRMLSQKLTKEILLLSHQNEQSTNLLESLADIETTLFLWKDAHKLLSHYNDSIQKHNSDTTYIKKMFSKLDPLFETIYQNSQQVISLTQKRPYPTTQIQQHINAVIFYEPLFLKQMDAIVYQYEIEAQKKISRLKKIEYSFFLLIFLILILEFLFLFRPAALSIKKTILDLLNAKEKANDMAEHAQYLRKIQNENVQELVALTKALDQTLLYARVDAQGGIHSIGNRFKKLLDIEKENYQKQNLVELMPLGEIEQNKLLNLITQDKGNIYNEVFEFFAKSGEKIWLDISILTVFKASGTSDRLVLCSDISKRKEAQNELERLRTIKYQEKEETQKANASLIVEAQEEERKRIAKEIHDSIGQMTTALKFNIESINIHQPEKATQKIEGLKKLSKDLIQGIRFATFNLTPPELKDYGITIALQKMTRELTKLTSKEILFDNHCNPELRFDTLVETNLYRVTQEAVNNAIKYAQSDYILITIKNSKSLLSIVIEDNGKGFDLSKIPEKPTNNAEGGMGLFFMKERMHYINGRIFINSSIGNGSRITLNYKF